MIKRKIIKLIYFFILLKNNNLFAILLFLLVGITCLFLAYKAIERW